MSPGPLISGGPLISPGPLMSGGPLISGGPLMSDGPLMSGGPLISGVGPGPDWKGPEGPWLLGPVPINGGGCWVPVGCIGTTGSTGLCKMPYNIQKKSCSIFVHNGIYIIQAQIESVNSGIAR